MQRYYGRPVSAFLSAHPSASSSSSSSSSSRGAIGGAEDEAERVVVTAKASPMALKYPIVVDWDAGKIAVGNVADVEEMLQARAKLRDGGGDGDGGDGGGERKKGLLSSLFGSS